MALAVLVTAAVAGASPSARLVYARGPGAGSCASESVLRQAVAARLGYDPFFPHAAKTVIAEIEQDGHGFRGAVRIVDDDGNVRGARTLRTQGDDCGELVGAMALALSIGLDDLDSDPPSAPTPPSELPSSPSSTEPEPASPASPSPPSPSPPLPSPPSRVAEPRPDAIHGSATLGPTLAFGVAPAPAFGARIGGGVRRRWFGARLDVRGDLPASRALSPSGDMSLRSVMVTPSLCAHAPVPFVCLAFGVGHLWSETEALARPASDGAWVVAPSVRGGIDVPLGERFYLEGLAEAGAHLARHRVVVDDRTVYELPAVWATLGIQLGVALF